MPHGQMDEAHSTLSLLEDEPAINKETSGFPTSQPLSDIICFMAVTWYLWHTVLLMWWYSHIRVSMMFADGMAPIWRQDICKHRDDVARPATSTLPNVIIIIWTSCRPPRSRYFCSSVTYMFQSKSQPRSEREFVRGTEVETKTDSHWKEKAKVLQREIIDRKSCYLRK